MPRIARTFIKTGLIYFLVSLLLGLAFEIDSLNFPGMMPLFWHLLMVGWITQIIFGVSMWMFPGRTREEGFVAQKWAWLTYFLLNTGLVLRIIAEPVVVTSPRLIWDIMILFSGLFQAAAAVTYLIELWPRIQSKEQRRKNRRKKRKKK
ncbi:MAG TPA: hypothetical protein VK112_08955 [Fodinibius sp.]|nr:hypothetical protein [Fodinibius sp.]